MEQNASALHPAIARFLVSILGFTNLAPSAIMEDDNLPVITSGVACTYTID